MAARVARLPQELAEGALAVARGEQRQSESHAWERVRQFADMLSHALNQPLNAALLMTQLLEHTDASLRTEEARAGLQQLRRNLLRTDAVLRDAHAAALSRADSLHGGRCPWGQVLGETLAELGPELNARGVRVVVQEPVAEVLVNGTRVRAVLSALIRELLDHPRNAETEHAIHIACEQGYIGEWWVLVSSGVGENYEAALAPPAPEGRSGPGPDLPTDAGASRAEAELFGGAPELAPAPWGPAAFRFRLAAASTARS